MIRKKELVNELAERTGYTKGSLRGILDALEDIVYDNIADEEIQLFNGIILCSVYREEHIGRDPYNNKPVTIPGKRYPKCRFGSKARAAVNGQAAHAYKGRTQAALDSEGSHASHAVWDK